MQNVQMDYVDPEPPRDCAFRWYRDSDAPTMAQSGYPPLYINDRRKNGARIVVAEFEGRAVGWKIMQTGTVDQLSWLRVLVPPDMVFALAEFVSPDMRGKHVGYSMHEFVLAHYRSEGYRRIGCNVETWNTYQINRLRGTWSEITTATRRNYLLFHTAEVNGKRHVGLWGRFNRFPLEIH
jgi:GNAT superfamily N-acetyltransferase